MPPPLVFGHTALYPRPSTTIEFAIVYTHHCTAAVPGVIPFVTPASQPPGPYTFWFSFLVRFQCRNMCLMAQKRISQKHVRLKRSPNLTFWDGMPGMKERMGRYYKVIAELNVRVRSVQLELGLNLTMALFIRRDW